MAKLIDRQTTTEDNSDGNRMQFLYDGAGHLTTITDPTNRKVQFDYNPDTAPVGSRGLISKVTDFDGRIVTYTNSSSGQLTGIDGPDPASAASRKPHTTLAWNTGSGDLKTTLYKAWALTTATDGESRQIFQIAYDAAKPAIVKTLTYGIRSQTAQPPKKRIGSDVRFMESPRTRSRKKFREGSQPRQGAAPSLRGFPRREAGTPRELHPEVEWVWSWFPCLEPGEVEYRGRQANVRCRLRPQATAGTGVC